MAKAKQTADIKQHLLLSEICNDKRMQHKGIYERYDLQNFSADMSLQDYQIASVQNALIALDCYMCYKDSEYRQNRGAKLYRIYQEKYKDFRLKESEINRASFWMATGSGKTIVMIKLLSLLGKAMREGSIPNKPIILLAPNDTILKQFKNNITKYNNYNGDSLSVRELKEYESVDNTSLLEETIVFIARSDLLDCKENVGKDKNAKRLDYKNYCNDCGWYILLDEAHKGDSKDSIRKSYINELACGDKQKDYEGFSKGFIFNFSATFSDEIDFLTCAFNYNLEKFNRDGYGKNIALLDSNLKSFGNENDENERITRIIEGFILFSAIKQSKEKLSEKAKSLGVVDIKYHNPLIIAVSDKVNTKDAGIKLYFEAILQILKEDRDIQEIANNLYEKLQYQELYFAKNTLSDEFKECVKNIDSKNVRKYIFHASEPSSLECLRANDKELAFKSKNANEPFILLNIGETKKWEKEHLLELGVENFKDLQKNYFKDINSTDSSINIMLGSKVFSEGWDSNRVNLIYFINIGSKNANKYVLQTIGRGVRIEPFAHVRKRMQYNQLEYATKEALSSLSCGIETLFVLASDTEAIKFILGKIESFITQYPIKGFKKTNILSPLPTPKYKETQSKDKNYRIDKTEATHLRAYIESFDEDVLVLSKCVIHKECSYETLQEIQKFLHNNSTRIQSSNGDMQKFDKNTTISRIDRILHATNRELQEFVDLSDEINHYQKFQTTLGQDFANEINEIIKNILNTKSEEELKADFESGEINIDEFAKNLKSNAKKCNIKDYAISAELKEHYYNPLIVSNKDDKNTEINFAISQKSEREFLKDLEDFLQTDSKRLDKYEWCFSKIVENIDDIYIPYFDSQAQSNRKFYPDFIFWFRDKATQEYKIVFIDPKGLSRETNPIDKIKGFESVYVNQKFSYKNKEIKVYLYYYNKTNFEFRDYESYKKPSIEDIMKEICE